MDEMLPLLDAANIRFADDFRDSRRLILESLCGRFVFFILRGIDATSYVQLGAADIGVVGKDMLLEAGSDNIYELLDLELAACRLMTAAPIGYVPPPGIRRVATKYVHSTGNYYAAKGIAIRIVSLYGSLELAPFSGIADEITDLVATGKTLHSNGLEALDVIARSSARLIVNRASMRLHYRAVNDLYDRLKQIVSDRQ